MTNDEIELGAKALWETFTAHESARASRGMSWEDLLARETREGGILADLARAEVRNVLQAVDHHRRAGAPFHLTDRIEQDWQDILELPDRNSPPEYPDMALITFDEFRDMLLDAVERELMLKPPGSGAVIPG